MIAVPRDHGGGLDDAARIHGGVRADWLDLSTGINPVPYPLPRLAPEVWAALPDRAASAALIAAARRFWGVPDAAGCLAVPGASVLIAQIPRLRPPASVAIPEPAYNEYKAVFRAAGWTVTPSGRARVIVHPNNPDGRLWSAVEAIEGDPDLLVIDESFCDAIPGASLIRLAARPGTLMLKSFGKFWGLAGLRLGFAIGDPELLAGLADALGPWPVSGPALQVGRAALEDPDWAGQTRARLAGESTWLDALMLTKGVTPVGGTPLFRLFHTGDAAAWQQHLARGRIWSRIFPWSRHWLRLGLPAPDRRARLEHAL